MSLYDRMDQFVPGLPPESEAKPTKAPPKPKKPISQRLKCLLKNRIKL